MYNTVSFSVPRWQKCVSVAVNIRVSSAKSVIFFQHNGGTLELAGQCAPIIPCALIADPGREVFESADAPASLKSDAWKHFGFLVSKN